jgi:hypothetical protein
LFVILAREAPRAVILRRGPSRSVLQVGWDTGTDRFTEGQWLRGRIYERRCDLSPNGELLLYFAAKWGTPMKTWSAISRVPWFTALALYPKGDAWGGGGLFEGPRSVVLNHPYGLPDPKLAPGYALPPRFRVRDMGLRSRGGEDFPVYGLRLERDGWVPVPPDEARGIEVADRSPSWHRYDPPIVLRKLQPTVRAHTARALTLEQRVLGVHESGGSGDWWLVEHALRASGRVVCELGRTEWADWDRTGDLLFARDGVLFRLPRPTAETSIEEARELIDLRDRRFEARASPPAARRW